MTRIKSVSSPGGKIYNIKHLLVSFLQDGLQKLPAEKHLILSALSCGFDVFLRKSLKMWQRQVLNWIGNKSVSLETGCHLYACLFLSLLPSFFLVHLHKPSAMQVLCGFISRVLSGCLHQPEICCRKTALIGTGGEANRRVARFSTFEGETCRLLPVRMLLMQTFPKTCTHSQITTHENTFKWPEMGRRSYGLFLSPAVSFQIGKGEATFAAKIGGYVLPCQYSPSLESAPVCTLFCSQKDLNYRCQNCGELNSGSCVSL